MVAIILGSGTIRDYSLYKKYFKRDLAPLVICADGGAHHARHMGVHVDYIMGDFDSIRHKDFLFLVDSGTKTVSFPKEKDETDTELAVLFAMEKGCKTIYIFGGLGTRMDHSLANIFLLKKMIDYGVQGFIIDEHNVITMIDKECTFFKEIDKKVSLIPVTDTVKGINTKGLQYELKDATLSFGPSRGISNEFIEDKATISIKSGLLLVILAKD